MELIEKKNIFEILNESLNKRNKTLTDVMDNYIDACHFLHSLETEYSFDFTDASVNLFLFAKDKYAVRWLVNAGADINNGWESGITALSYAVYDRDEDLIYTFLEEGAKPNKKFLEELGILYSPSFVECILPFLDEKDMEYIISIRKRFPENMQEFLYSLKIK